MSILVVLFHLMACIALIAIVLLQTGKGAEMGAAFGGASQTLFGGTGGSSFMSKLTTGAAIVFMITSLLLSYMYRPGFRGGRSVMTDIPIEQPSKFELVVNLKTAKEIGTEIPANFVLRADKVVE